jgi:hypothetical protein
MAKHLLTSALLIGSVCFGLPRAAHALEPAATLSTVQITGGPRYGTHDLSLGLGLRGGYTLPQSFYVGGVFDYFFGSTQNQSYALPYGVQVSTEIKNHLWLLGGEFGYDIGLTPSIVVRPYVGIGYASGYVKSCVSMTGTPTTCMSGSGDDAFFELGGSFNYFNGRFFFGGDARFFHAGDDALVLGAHIGVMF